MVIARPRTAGSQSRTTCEIRPSPDRAGLTRPAVGPAAEPGRQIAEQKHDRSGQHIIHEDHVDGRGDDEQRQIECRRPGKPERKKVVHYREVGVQRAAIVESLVDRAWSDATLSRTNSPPAVAASAIAHKSGAAMPSDKTFRYQSTPSAYPPIKSDPPIPMPTNMVVVTFAPSTPERLSGACWSETRLRPRASRPAGRETESRGRSARGVLAVRASLRR